VIAAATVLLLAQAEVAEPEQVCDDPQTQLAMNTCAAMDFERADERLNEQWRETAAYMQARDAEIDHETDSQPGYYETLLAAQRAWLAYRDAQCRSEGFMARGGSMQPMLVSMCKAYVTELRTEQLRVLAAGPEAYLTGGQTK
jgi:uncharacterized protein YecT (DUF1311 family)